MPPPARPVAMVRSPAPNSTDVVGRSCSTRPRRQSRVPNLDALSPAGSVGCAPFVPGICRIGAGDPRFRPLPAHAESFQRNPNRRTGDPLTDDPFGTPDCRRQITRAPARRRAAIGAAWRAVVLRQTDQRRQRSAANGMIPRSGKGGRTGQRHGWHCARSDRCSPGARRSAAHARRVQRQGGLGRDGGERHWMNAARLSMRRVRYPPAGGRRGEV